MTALEQYVTSYFGVAEAEELKVISSLFKPETIKKGDYFLLTGKASDRLSFIQNGILRIFLATENKEVTQWISTKGYFVTDLSGFIFEKPSEHKFELIDHGNGTTTFIQSEKFKGILVSLFAKQLDNNTKRGFMEMNLKLKAVAECSLSNTKK